VAPLAACPDSNCVYRFERWSPGRIKLRCLSVRPRQIQPRENQVSARFERPISTPHVEAATNAAIVCGLVAVVPRFAPFQPDF